MKDFVYFFNKYYLILAKLVWDKNILTEINIIFERN